MSTANALFLIFIVEDDNWYAEVLEYQLSLNPDYVIEKYSNGEDCLKNLHKNPAIICVDYSLPDMDGKTLLKKINRTNPTTPIIVISGQKDVKHAIEILKEENVSDYIVKDEETKERLWKAVIKIQEKRSLVNEIEQLKEEVERKYDFQESIKGNSESLKNVFRLMQKACDNNITVSISGETGTGKELVAKCIHYNSQRSKKPYVAVNMTAVPKELVESELFGHEKGAFTGAQTRRIGKFEEANKGSIFLDEIADMDIATQAKILRVLQEREINRIGDNKPIKIDVRIIVATHKNLAEEVKKGNFREDLYYRLLGFPIELPPLRERKEDILVLAKYFVTEFCKDNNKRVKGFSMDAKAKLSNYHYPGNIRELKAIIELAEVMSDGNEIEAKDVSFNNTATFTDFIVEGNTLKDYTLKIIKHFLEKYNNDIETTAQKLDIGKSTLYRMIKNGEV
jgi:two-component system, NtrC family, response regulator AtoC